MKFILIGNSGVGKSCMLYQFMENTFTDSIEPTIGIEFGTKMMKIKDKKIRLQIWDSAGQENYRSITRSYYRNTICTFLMFDVTNRKSFNDIKVWHEEAKTYGNSQMYFVLVGNKCEMEDEREVSEEEGRNFSTRNGMLFFETSAKKNINILKAFETIVDRIVGDIRNGKIDPYNESLGVKVGMNNMRENFLDNVQQEKKEGCC